jgi:6-phosphogluconolactonase
MKKLISVIILICFFNLTFGQNQTYTLLIDTYVSSSGNDGIYVYDFNSQTGDFKFKSKVAGEDKPSYVTTSSDGKYVYSVNEVRNGSISAYALNSKTGELTFLNRASTGGDSPCYAATDAKNKILFAGNYGSGSISVYSLKDDGSIGNTLQFIQNVGGSIDKRRQAGPHVHGTVLSPDEKFLLSPDLGTDKVNVYRFDPNNLVEPLTPADPAFVSVKAGSGPRHLIFHPNSKFVYLTHEIGGLIVVFDYENGKLSEKQTITMQASYFKGSNGGADIHISEDGRFLYASNRGDANEIIIYSINKKDGKLECIDHQPSMGKTPRNFAIDPTGAYLLVANQESNVITFFRRNQKTGLLTPTGKKIEISRPVCIKFLERNE